MDPISGLWTWYMPLGHGTSGWDMVHAPGTGPHVQHGLHGLHGMDCMAWTAWHGLHGLPCMVSRGKTDLFHFWLVSGHAQGGLHVQSQLEHVQFLCPIPSCGEAENLLCWWDSLAAGAFFSGKNVISGKNSYF